MGFFRTLKRLFQGYDVAGGGSHSPMSRKERREEQRRIQKLKKKRKAV